MVNVEAMIGTVHLHGVLAIGEAPDPRSEREILAALSWEEYVKTAPISAVRMALDFSVRTLEGIVHGAAGDWLAAASPDGEFWPIAADRFAATYVRSADDPAGTTEAVQAMIGVEETMEAARKAMVEAQEALAAARADAARYRAMVAMMIEHYRSSEKMWSFLKPALDHAPQIEEREVGARVIVRLVR